MDLTDTPQQAAYRARVRAWLAENREHAPTEKAALHIKDIEPFRVWQRRLAEAGFVGVTWPAEYGGQGLGMIEQAILNNELHQAGLPGLLDIIGVGNLGPTVIMHGTPSQKDRHLKPLMLGEEIWCQLFSEPAAGSDLAGIRTKATRTDRAHGPDAQALSGGGWRIDGQKVWTTMAQHAAFGLMLARTDTSVPKHQGLTMFILPMNAPGVTVRPLRQLTGMAAFNEVFIDGVELPYEAAVGEPGEGWSVAMTCLMYERFNLLTMLDSIGWHPTDFTAAMANATVDQKRRMADVVVDMLAVRYSGYRALSKVSNGELPGPEAGLGKITLIDAAVKGAQLVTEALGPSALDGDWGQLLAELQGLRSGGGTDEILLTTIGERVLGLPTEPRVDKKQPFSELERS